MRQRRETVELGTIKARMGRGIRPSAAQNVAAFGAGVFVLGLICALLRIGRNAFRYAGITRAIVLLAARADRFLEISDSLDPQACRVQLSINLPTPRLRRCKRQRLRKRFASRASQYIRRETARWTDVAQA